MKIVVGLGNPGEKYANTYHNVGWLTLDAVAAALGITIKTAECDSLTGVGSVGGERVILEIDPPRDEISTRRLGFYRRLGFHDSPLPYVHPSYSRPFEPHHLVLMGYPAPLEQEEARRLADFVRRVVLHYTEHRQPTLPRIP